MRSAVPIRPASRQGPGRAAFFRKDPAAPAGPFERRIGSISLPRDFSIRTTALEIFMLDVLMLAIGLVFFALSVAYAYACERL
ncbi:hypothetical protein [Mesorhizobium sp. SP-1A]|uniref:hypothetical protein n=1 Tax=Mesorhizobium sp. SP-1A TaxID=3077840 RepID=UPI0028F73453|nr:hypothetical protein [Mesorhizobium sp. SP-1A]